MRSSLGLVLGSALVWGGCDSGIDDDYVPQIPPTGVAESFEPVDGIADDNARPLVRVETAAIPGDDVRTGSAYALGRESRARYDRLRAAGFIH